MSGLTPKQARFVAEYLKDSNATQAAIRAGYSKHTAQEQGSRLLSNVMVRAAVDAGREKIAKKLEITAEKLIRDTDDIRQRATADGVYASALKAIDMLGNTLPEGNPFEGVTNISAKVTTDPPDPLELMRIIAFAFAEAREATPAQPEPLH